MTNAERIAAELVAVHGFYGRELPEGSLRMWLDLIGDIPADTVVAALLTHTLDPERGTFPPMPADVMRHIRGGTDEAATLAWADFIAGKPLDHIGEQALQAIGGRSAWGRSDESQNGFLHRRFVEAYRAFRHRDEREAMAQSLGTRVVERIKG